VERGGSPSGRRRVGWTPPWRSLLFLAALAVAFRVFCCSALRVATGSMEPLIHGDPARGDELLVFDQWFRIWSPSRFDLAVFERPDNDPTEKLNVKRIVGLPGETIRITDGDLFVTAAGSTREVRVQKTYSEFKPLLVRRFFERFGDEFERHFTFDPSEVRPERGRVTLIGGENEGHSADIELDRQAVGLDDGWMDASGLDHPGTEPERDLVFELEVALTKPTACIHFDFELGVNEYRFEIVPYGPGHDVMLSRLDNAMDPIRRAIRSVSTGSKHRLAFFHVDGRAGVVVDGRSELWEDLPGSGVSLGPGRGFGRPKFGVWAGDAYLTKYEIWRDIHYTEPPDATYAGRSQSCRIPADQVFVLGDHSSDSVDSRFYGPVPKKNLRGLPFLIQSPSPHRALIH
jgi:signal peptidase I